VDHDLIAKSPAARVKAPRGEAREGVAFTVEEARKLLTECSEEWLFGLVFLGLRTGLRRANIEGLRWGQVDLEARKLVFAAGEMKMRRAHPVPIHAELLSWLQERKDRLQPNPEDPVIGKVPAGERNNRAFKGALQRAGITDARRVHDLRHTVSTWLAQAGVDRGLRDKILAHESRSGDMAAKYTHFRWEDVVAAVDKLPKLFPGSPLTTENPNL
jgi:integrase